MLFIYRILTNIFFPLFALIIFFRKIVGKEDSQKYKEKIFLSSKKQFDEKKTNLLWFHGASIGEVMSIFPIINEIISKNSEIKILITSVTLSSGRIVEKEFKNNKNIYHSYFPLDVGYLAKKFLEKWKPRAVFFVDSEIWPNFLSEINKRKISLILLNGRITDKTFKRWKIIPGLSQKIFSLFDFCLAASNNSYENLKKLGVKKIKFIGNLKYVSNNKNITKLSNEYISHLSKFKVWCAASTHEGEELICIEAHKRIKKVIENLITIIIPRHINRSKDIYDTCIKQEIDAQILNDKDKINDGAEILIINSFGQMSRYFDHCNSVFIGKSLIGKLKPVGGQNPIEAAVKGCKIYHGPYVYNFREIYDFLNEKEISQKIENYIELSEKIIKDLKNNTLVKTDQKELISLYGQKILKDTSLLLNNYIK